MGGRGGGAGGSDEGAGAVQGGGQMGGGGLGPGRGRVGCRRKPRRRWDFQAWGRGRVAGDWAAAYVAAALLPPAAPASRLTGVSVTGSPPRGFRMAPASGT